MTKTELLTFKSSTKTFFRNQLYIFTQPNVSISNQTQNCKIKLKYAIDEVAPSDDTIQIEEMIKDNLSEIIP